MNKCLKFVYVCLCHYVNEVGGPSLSLEQDWSTERSRQKQSLPSESSLQQTEWRTFTYIFWIIIVSDHHVKYQEREKMCVDVCVLPDSAHTQAPGSDTLPPLTHSLRATHAVRSELVHVKQPLSDFVEEQRKQWKHRVSLWSHDQSRSCSRFVSSWSFCVLLHSDLLSLSLINTHHWSSGPDQHMK